jgi:hypothetical protein
MERQRVLDRAREVRAKIEELKALLASDEKIREVVVEARGDPRAVRRRAAHRAAGSAVEG